MLSKTRVGISMKQSFHMEAHLQRDFQEADNNVLPVFDLHCPLVQN